MSGKVKGLLIGELVRSTKEVQFLSEDIWRMILTNLSVKVTDKPVVTDRSIKSSEIKILQVDVSIELAKVEKTKTNQQKQQNADRLILVIKSLMVNLTHPKTS